MDAAPAGTIGGTYCGNPLACAAAIKTMEIMKAEDYCGKSMHIGKVVTEAFEKMKEKYSYFMEDPREAIRLTQKVDATEFVQRYLKEYITTDTHDILDIGCGPAVIDAHLGLQYPEVQITGIDISSVRVEQAQKKKESNQSKKESKKESNQNKKESNQSKKESKKES